MESTLLGVVLDSSIVITAERRSLPIPALMEAIQAAVGDVEVSLSPISVAELVHGVYRAKTAEAGQRRRDYIQELIDLVPVHPVTVQSAYLTGQIEGQEAAKGNVLPFSDLLIAVTALEQGYAVLTENTRHFGKVPGLQIRKLFQ